MILIFVKTFREEKSAVKCVSDWGKKCLKGFPRQLMHLILSGATRNIKERCAPKGRKVTYSYTIKKNECINFNRSGTCQMQSVSLIQRQQFMIVWMNLNWK